MRLLLDTHTLFWSVDDSSMVSAPAMAAMVDPVSLDVAFDPYGVTRIW